MFKKVLQLTEKLDASQSSEPGVQAAIANAYDNLGTMYLHLRRNREAEEVHKKGWEIRKALHEKAPTNQEYQNALAISDVNMGTLYATTGRPAEAEPYLQEAVTLGQRLVDEHPGVVLYQNALAASLNNFGGMYTLLGDNANAEVVHRRSLAIREQMAAEHPAVLEYTLRLASSYTNLGELAVRENRGAPALEWLDKAVTILDGVLQKEPRETTARYYLSYTQSWRAKALQLLSRFDEALAAWDKAIEFDDREDQSLRDGRAIALAARDAG